jgi:hypothetical protein
MNVNAALAQVKELLAGGTTRNIARCIAPELAVTTAIVPTTNRIYWSRVIEGGRVGHVRFQVQAQAGNLCVAYAKNVGTGVTASPGALLGSTGSFACPTSTEPHVTGGGNGDSEQTLEKSVYVPAGAWMGLAVSNAAISLRCATSSSDVDTILAAGSQWRETIASGGPVIPAERAALTAHFGRNWLIEGVA